MKKIIKSLSLIFCLLLLVSMLFACEKRTPATVIIEPAEEETELELEEISNLSNYTTEVPYGQEIKVENQGEDGACWAYATCATLEYTLAKDEVYDFSEDHMLKNNGFGLSVEDGGDYTMSMGYLTSWKGPVLEADDPNGDDETNTLAEDAVHVQEIQIATDKDYEEIKKMIYNYGAVESAIYIALGENDTIDLTYYNESKCSYCYTDGSTANHEVAIIGWDDDYPMENFNTGATRNGAFVCVNSWGSEFGNRGIFYVSYDDSLIGTMAVAYTKIESTDNYNNIYQNDECGWIGRSGFGTSTAYFANVYTAIGNENLKAVGFYATGPSSTYKVYVCDNYSNESSLNINGRVYAEGTLENAGYYTINLEDAIPLQIGCRYAVIVEINTPGEVHPVAVEMQPSDGRETEITTLGKESLISADGRNWENTQGSSESNVCLKAYTNDQ